MPVDRPLHQPAQDRNLMSQNGDPSSAYHAFRADTI